MLKRILFLSVCGWVSLLMGAEVNPEIALNRLVEGNLRFQNEKLLHPNRGSEAREAVAVTQTPFATILGCSDSRASPEIIFDQGIGDLFIVRVAGNVAGPIELDSVEYSALIGSSLILVLGHENCGAVRAVVENKAQDIESVAALIAPAITKAKQESGALLENSIKENILSVVNEIKKSAVIKNLMLQKKIDVVGGYYHFQNGKVEILSQKE